MIRYDIGEAFPTSYGYACNMDEVIDGYYVAVTDVIELLRDARGFTDGDDIRIFLDGAIADLEK